MNINKYGYEAGFFLMLNMLSFIILTIAVEKKIAFLIIISFISIVVFTILTLFKSINAMGYFKHKQKEV